MFPWGTLFLLKTRLSLQTLRNCNNGEFFILYEGKQENDKYNETSCVRSCKNQFFTYSAEMHRLYPEGSSKHLRFWAYVSFKQLHAFTDLMEAEDLLSVPSGLMDKEVEQKLISAQGSMQCTSPSQSGSHGSVSLSMAVSNVQNYIWSVMQVLLKTVIQKFNDQHSDRLMRVVLEMDR